MGVQILECRDCGAEFVFNEGEQTFFLAHDLKPPMRCGECRKKRRGAVQQRRQQPRAFQNMGAVIMKFLGGRPV